VTTNGRVAVIGDIIRDIVVSPEGPIQHDTDTPARIDVHFGGSAANTAVWLGYLGAPVGFAGRAGVDDVSAVGDYLNHFGVDPRIPADPDHPSGTIVVIVQGDSRSMLTDRGANTFLDADAVPESLYQGAAYLHLTGYSFFHSTRPEQFLALIDRARAGGTRVSVDCSSVGFLAAYGVEAWWNVLSHVDIVRGNADEACLITGTADPVEATMAIASRGHQAVITRAAEGALWCEPGGEVGSLPAAPLGPEGFVDPTGAGDSFTAGFLATLSSGGTVREAVRAGLTLSATVVGQWGASPQG
jgi:sugar/nucleoside kinase (ribokinase family)